MNELLDNLMRLNEDDAGVKALWRVYHDVEQNIDPDPTDVFTAIDMMEHYYHDYLVWYQRHSSAAVREEDKIIIGEYRKRLTELRVSKGSRDPGEMLVTLDTAVNQWHRDFPAITHMMMGADDDESEALLDKVAQILVKLGRLPPKSPYA